MDDFVVICVPFPLVEKVDLECEKRQLQRLGYKREGLGCVLLFKKLRILPTTCSKSLLYVLCLWSQG
jgi:hypothetical protein